MTFGDAIAGALPRLREYAERLMVDEVAIARPSGAVDPVTGEAVLEPVYSGKAKVQTYEGYEQDRELGGGSVTTQRYRVDLPVGAYAARVDDVVTVTRATFDPNLADRRYVVRGPFFKSMATACRMFVDDLNGFGRTDG